MKRRTPFRHCAPSRRHCERSAAIHAPGPSALDRHNLQPRDDEKNAVIASEARQSMPPASNPMDRHGLQPRDDEKNAVIASEARQSILPTRSPVNQVYNVAVGDRTTLNNLATNGVSADTQPIYRDFRAGDVRHSQADIGKAQRPPGYAPTHRLAEAMPWYMAKKQ